VLELLGLESLWISSSTDPHRALERCLAIAADEDGQRHAVLRAVAAAKAQWDQVPQVLREVEEGHRARERGLGT
jgi:hypothetical protein